MTEQTAKVVHPAWELVYAMQRDHQALGAKIAALRQWLASQDLPEPNTVTCPRCGLQCRGPHTLAEHVYHGHDGPLPDHWQEAA